MLSISQSHHGQHARRCSERLAEGTTSRKILLPKTEALLNQERASHCLVRNMTGQNTELSSADSMHRQVVKQALMPSLKEYSLKNNFAFVTNITWILKLGSRMPRFHLNSNHRALFKVPSPQVTYI